MAKLVLIIEDDDDTALLFEAVLRHNGFQVEICPDGAAGLDTVREFRPDLVLLDISMPKKDGWQVARAVRADPELKTIPIIGVTAHAEEADKLKAREIGFTSYLTKPIEPRKVADEVRRLIGPDLNLDFDNWDPVTA